jgi:hypothetical protein
MKKQTLSANTISYQFSTETLEATFERLAIIQERLKFIVSRISYGKHGQSYEINLITKRPMELSEIMIVL